MQLSFLKGRSAVIIWFALILVIIYAYFLKWKLTSVHDDDLYVLIGYTHLKPGFEKFNTSLIFGQYRPVRDFFLHLLLMLFGKNFTAIYCFNVFILSLNTVLMACSLNLFLRSIGLSFFTSLIVGMSRFSFYSATQLFNGGVMEGLASTSFLLFLNFSAKAAMPETTTPQEKKRLLLWSILFANLAMYTHERFTILCLFPVLLVLLPNFSRLNLKQKSFIGLLALVSPCIYITVKKYFFHLDPLLGTGNTKTSFNLVPALINLKESILSVFQISVAPPYIAGYSFSDLSFLLRSLVILTAILIGLIFILYFKKLFTTRGVNPKGALSQLLFFISLAALFGLCLGPCIFQAKVELRWLHAPLCTALLMLAIAMGSLQFNNPKTKPLLLSLITISFLITNYFYISKGAQNLFFTASARIGDAFDKAIKEKVIQPGKPNLYIWLKERNSDQETDINWALGGGEFFTLYKNNKKRLLFIDSTFFSARSGQSYSFPGFNNKTDQIVFCDILQHDYTYDCILTDVTNQFISDIKGIRYFQNRLMITNYDFNKFAATGFYDQEGKNDIRWTNGRASLGFLADFNIKDTVTVAMNTFMPPSCKNVNPQLSIITDKKTYNAVTTKREGNKFIYKYYIGVPSNIKKIQINSDTINNSTDGRTLSFPFISLEIKNGSLN